MHREYWELTGEAVSSQSGRQACHKCGRYGGEVAGAGGFGKGGGKAFQWLDGSFYLTRSTLLMLISVFTGKELIDRACRKATGLGYCFCSFGDATLIL